MAPLYIPLLHAGTKENTHFSRNLGWAFFFFFKHCPHGKAGLLTGTQINTTGCSWFYPPEGWGHHQDP